MFKRVTISLLVCLALLTTVVGCAPTSSGEAAEMPETNLGATIEVPATLTSGETVKLGFTLTNNADTSLYVLKWFTPLEGLGGEIFRVEHDGQVVPYEGPLASRTVPTPEAYVLLDAGESVFAEVDLATAYDFSKAGEYTIEFLSPSISHVARTEADMAKALDDLGPVQIPSNRVSVKITSSSMLNIGKTILDGAILSAITSIFLAAVMRFNPRLFLRDYPENIQNQVPPKTEKEKRQSLVVGIPFLILLAAVPFISTLALKRQSGEDASFLHLFLNAFGVAFVFNLVDLLLLDWLIFCFITPKFVVIPGTEGMEGYKDYFFHFRASIFGAILSVVAGLVIAGIVSFL